MPAVADVVRHEALRIDTTRPTTLVDITDALSDAVQRTRLSEGFVMVQTRHTTTGLLVNEHEPLLRASECIAVTGGVLGLGRWQRVFFVDFDGGQRRTLSLTFVGT